MYWPLYIRKSFCAPERCIWGKDRILRETGTVILVQVGTRLWIPNSRIRAVRLRQSTFEIYVKENTVG